MSGRITLDDAQLDRCATRLTATQSALNGLKGQLNASLAAGAPPALRGRVEAAVAEAAIAVASVASRCSTRQVEFRRHAALTRIAGGEGTPLDLSIVLRWSGARIGNGTNVDGGNFAGLVGKGMGKAGNGISKIGGFLGKIDPGAAGHAALDLAGLVPLFGEPADLVNGAWYGAEGNTTEAALSLAGAVPFLGWGAAATKGARRVDKLVDGAGKAAKGAKLSAEEAAAARRLAGVTESPKRFDYSKANQGERVNFKNGEAVRVKRMDRDRCFLNFHDGKNPGSYRYWSPVEEGGTFRGAGEAMDKLALKPEWGARDAVTKVCIPKGTKISALVGKAAPQTAADGKVLPGGGTQWLFNKFDERWITDIKPFK